MNRPKLLFFFPNTSSFVNRDVQLLQSRYRVVTFAFNPSRKIFIPFSFVRQLLFLFRHIFSAGIVVCQVAAWHSVLPVFFARLAHIPSVIFLAGTDCAYFPSIRYGNFCNKPLAWATRVSARYATHLAPKHDSLIRFKYDYDSSGAPVQGIAVFVPQLKTPFTVIPNGFNSTDFSPLPDVRKAASFITVAAGVGTSNINVLKGIDLILQIAPLFPQCTFTIAGLAEGFMFDNVPSNITTLPQQTPQQLKQLFSTHTYYLQLSLSEGFPNAVCEAMLCGCIPIVSAVNALPDIAHDCGFVLPEKDITLLTELINKALTADTQALSLKAINHIRKNYPPEQRQEKLFELFEKLKG